MTEDTDHGPVPDREPETPEAPETLGATATGVPAADAAAQRLRTLEGAPLEEHVEVYEDVHRRLQEGLADLDDR